MMFTSFCNANMMNRQTSAHCAEAGFSCAKTASNSMMTILDAMIVASIIITLISLVSVLVLGLSIISLISLLAIVILLVVVLVSLVFMPKRRITA